MRPPPRLWPTVVFDCLIVACGLLSSEASAARPPVAYQGGALRPGLGLGLSSGPHGTIFVAGADLGYVYLDYLAVGTGLTYQSSDPQLMQWEVYHIAYLPLAESDFMLGGVVSVGRLFLFDYSDMWTAAVGVTPTLMISERVGLELRVLYRFWFSTGDLVDRRWTANAGLLFTL